MSKNAKTSGGKKLSGLYTREDRTAAMAAADRKAQDAYAADYMGFLGAAKTERLAYAEAVRRIEKRGFKPLSSFRVLKPGDRVWRGYHGKTLFAAVIGSEKVSAGVRVVGGHTDAPRIDLKPVPVAEKGGIAYFDTHYYGGIKKFQWVAHPLAIHGVVCKKDGSTVGISVGDNPGDPVFMISDILPHFGKDQAKKPMSEAIAAENMDILAATTPGSGGESGGKDKVKENVLRILSERWGVEEEDLVSAELEAVPAGLPREMGLDRSMIIGYGQDDRVCAYAGLKALADLGKTPRKTAVVLLCDKEEIGSVGASGMDSTFFENSIAELVARQEPSAGGIAVRRALEASTMLSADVCAAADPIFPEADSPGNMARLNAGPCMIKYTGAGGKSGASDARPEFIARLRRIFDEAGVAWQAGELGRCEKGGGGTIAKFMAYYGMDVIDMGTPLLNMHAPWEGSSKFDCWMTYRAYGAFFADGHGK